MGDEEIRGPQQMPDPTVLTTQQLWREIASLKELLEDRIESIEKAIAVAHEDMVRVPTDVEKQVGNLKELHSTKIEELEKRLEDRFHATEAAISKADAAYEKRFDSINEFRGQLRDQQMTFIPRTEAEKSIDANSEKIATLAARIDRTEGRTGGLSAGWGMLVGAVGLIGALVAIVLAFRA